MEAIQQGRLWAVRLVSGGVIFHIVETGLPALFKRRGDAEVFKKRLAAIDPEHPVKVEVIGVDIVASTISTISIKR